MCGLFTLTTLLSIAPAFGSWGDIQEPAAAAATAAEVEFFEARIRPVLVERCYSCHNSSKRAKGGLVLDHRDGIREESDTGTAVVPGDPERSMLLKVVRHEIEDLEMPKDGPRLDDEVVADFERWIRNGAQDPRDAPPSATELSALTSWEATLARRKLWWSLQPIRAVEPPPSAWSDHPVDRFVESELEGRGLARAGPADRRTLIRRLSFVLTGLPPTPAEIEEFLADDEPGVTERWTDRLLASPRYGERWARHWMDVVRYADSHGSEGDPAIPNAYRYRDYLIRAFNQDVPYDQLVREHLAGDLLAAPRIDSERGIDESAIGTAHWRMVFHGFAPTDALDEKVRFVDDQINVFGKAFLGQTISCARCHDHKFDAISQKDYYALFGIFASTRPGMQDVNAPAMQALHQERLGGLKLEIRAAMAAAWSRELAVDAGARKVLPSSSPPSLPSPSLDGDSVPNARRWDLGSAAGMAEWFPTGNGLRAGQAGAGAFAVLAEGERVLAGIYPAGIYTHLLSTRHRGVLQSARVALDGEYEVWFQALGGGGAKLRYVVQDYPRGGTVYPITELQNATWSWHRLDLSYWNGDSVHWELCTALDAPVEAGGGERSWFGLRQVVLRRKGAGPPAADPDPLASLPADRGAAWIQAAIDAWARDTATDAQALLLDACLREGRLANTLADLPEVAQLVARYREVEAQVPLPTRVPGLLEGDAADQPLFLRGDHRRPGELAPRRFLEAIDAEPYATASSGRLELAEDLLRADNPLPARVIVNRIWHHLFGRGLVATPDNFGKLGAAPSHPELLDYLAQRMVERGWSIKDLVRFLVASKTWQLDSAPPDGALAADPDNVWLSHARVRRLDAEAIRDALFVAAERLDPNMYGPGFGADTATPRRSVYVTSRRNELDAFLAAFDSPVPFATTGARASTNVPAQSLAMLNGSLVREVAEQWGTSMRADPRFATDRLRLAHMFAAVTGRTPEDGEIQALAAYLEACGAGVRADRQRREALGARLVFDATVLESVLRPVRARLRAAASSAAAPAGPAPFARWDFRESSRDTVGALHGVLHGTARLADGGLLLDGSGHVSTPPIAPALAEKTLEAWVRLADLDQRGGGVVTVQGLRGNVFDSIVFGERIPRRWLAGSDGFRRTEDFGGSDESLAGDAAVHVAIAFDADGRIRGYRNGEPYGEPYRKAALVPYKAGDSQVLFGLRHGSPAPGRMLRGVIVEARLYDRALSAEEIAASAAASGVVSRAAILAALDEPARRQVILLEAPVAASRAELADLGEPAGEDEPWILVAHALFNLKEFLYLR